MENQNYVIAFPCSRNNTRYVNGSNKGADNTSCATIFSSVEDAEKEIEKIKAPLKEWEQDNCKLWIEDIEGNIQ
jgi:hypothetical protein